jgi:hypothetical protein
MSAGTSGRLKSSRSPPIVGAMEKARTVIVGGIILAGLMKCRTKTATSWPEAIPRRGNVGDEPHGPAAVRTRRRIDADGFVRVGR